MTIDDLFSSRDAFNSFIYTPWEEALKELTDREGDAALEAYVQKTVSQGIPEIMREKKSMVLFRHVATPNYEVIRFFIAADSLTELQPLILEYTADKFNNRNEWKYFLGRIPFHKGRSKAGEAIVETRNVIDFNTSANRPLSELETLWGQNLVGFHHELFENRFPEHAGKVFDLSSWLKESGPGAKEYYKDFLALFLTHGILFENFMIEDKEHTFTKEVIVPAFLEIFEETGTKPLIVALEPTHLEGDRFWLSHPIDHKPQVDKKMTREA